MEQKQLRLFGFEVNPYTEGDGSPKGSEEGDRGGKSLDNVFRKMEGAVKNKSSIGVLEHKKYECQFCLKEFMNSQALGGHQNAHKKERQKKRQMQLQAKSGNFNFFLETPQSCSVFNYNHSLPCFDDFSTCVPEFSLHKESLISFKPADQNKKLFCNMSHVSESIALASNNPLEQETCSRPVVIKPSPLYISKDCQSLYVQLGLARKPDIGSFSRRGCNRVG